MGPAGSIPQIDYFVMFGCQLWMDDRMERPSQKKHKKREEDNNGRTGQQQAAHSTRATHSLWRPLGCLPVDIARSVRNSLAARDEAGQLRGPNFSGYSSLSPASGVCCHSGRCNCAMQADHSTMTALFGIYGAVLCSVEAVLRMGTASAQMP